MLTAYRFTTGIYAPDGKLIRAVKNLGWLRAHWKDVTSFEMRPDYVLMAYLRDGNIYAIKWADPTVAREWLSRPVFRGVPVKWFGVDTKAGEIKWRAEYESAGGKRRRGGKARKPILAWKRPANLNELWEAAAPGGGRYVIRMIGAYRTGATRYEVNLTGTAYSNAYLGQAKSADAAKRMAVAHANRRAARSRAVAAGPTTRGPWDSGGKRRRARGSGGSGLIAAACALRDAWKK